MKQFKRYFLAFFLLLLFSTYQVGITAFTHVHYINGVLIAHSHPFKKNHTHSKSCLVVITQAASVHFLEADHSDYQFADYSNITLVLPKPCGLYQTSIHLQSPTLRAPPVVLI